VGRQGALTYWRAQIEGQIRKVKEGGQVRCTHILKSTERGTNLNSKNKQVNEVHSPSGECRRRVK